MILPAPARFRAGRSIRSMLWVLPTRSAADAAGAQSVREILPFRNSAGCTRTAAAAQAPASASLAASAQVISPVTIAATHPLDFGRAVSGGSSKTVAPNAAGGGRVEVYGAAGNTVTISMSMPAALKNTGADAIAVTGWNFMLSQSATLTGATTVPFSGITASVAASPDGTTGMGRLYLAIGATVQALATSPAGAYSGTGQVTVAYADL